MPKRAREAVWEPQWEGPIENWAKSFVHKNKWRCDPINDFDDLMQDAYLTFHKIKVKYPRVVEPANFMALFKVAMNNEMHDRASYVQRKRALIEDTSCDPTELLAGRISDIGNAGYIKLLLDDAPSTLRKALECLADNPEAFRSTGKKKENLNAKLCRLLGIEGSGFDFINGIRSLLS